MKSNTERIKNTEDRLSSSGPTSERPTKVPVGWMYFDTTENKPYFWSGTSWVNAMNAK